MRQVFCPSLVSMYVICACWLYLMNHGQLDDTEAAKKRHLVQQREQGKRIVLALYSFKQENALWPATLEEIQTQVLRAAELEHWEYQWHSDGWWTLTDIPGRLFGSTLMYEYRPDRKGWSLTDGVSSKSVSIDQPMPPALSLTKEAADRNSLRIIRNRISLSPRAILHHKGLISWHFRRQEYLQAKQACTNCLEKLPNHWWPNVMGALIDSQLGQAAAGELSLKQWVIREPGFNRYFFLSHYYSKTGDIDKALRILLKAAEYPLEDLDPCEEAGEYLGWRAETAAWLAATYALRQKRFDIALAVCDQWAIYRKKNYGAAEKSDLVIRAACYLAQKQFELAEKQLASVKQITIRTWADNLPQLEKAISLRDFMFVYRPGDFPPPLELMIRYE